MKHISKEKTINSGYENVARRGPRQPAEYQFAQQVAEREPSQYKQPRAVNFDQHEPACTLQQQVGHWAEKSNFRRSDTDAIVTVDPRTLNHPSEEHIVNLEEVHIHGHEHHERPEARHRRHLARARCPPPQKLDGAPQLDQFVKQRRRRAQQQDKHEHVECKAIDESPAVRHHCDSQSVRWRCGWLAEQLNTGQPSEQLSLVHQASTGKFDGPQWG